jgi:hypothetical protein
VIIFLQDGVGKTIFLIVGIVGSALHIIHKVKGTLHPVVMEPVFRNKLVSLRGIKVKNFNAIDPARNGAAARSSLGNNPIL